MEILKKCNGCKQDKPIEEFPIKRDYRKYKSGKTRAERLDSRCKKCNTKRQSAWVNRNRERARFLARKHLLSSRYGINTEDYGQMFKEQNGECAICGQPEKSQNHGFAQTLSVDHDHVTKRVRGLLCQRCNRVLGQIEDDVRILASMIAYLRGKIATEIKISWHQADSA